jgi:hypothetical protein
MLLTVRFVVFALGRYLVLVFRSGLGEAPEEILFSDVPILLVDRSTFMLSVRTRLRARGWPPGNRVSELIARCRAGGVSGIRGGLRVRSSSRCCFTRTERCSRSFAQLLAFAAPQQFERRFDRSSCPRCA